jgi:hypothetical protein
MRLPQSGPGTGRRPGPAAFVVSAGHTLRLRSRLALLPPLAGEMPTRATHGYVNLEW